MGKRNNDKDGDARMAAAGRMTVGEGVEILSE